MVTRAEDAPGRAASSPPERIVSLVPSVTETLAALGLAARVVGRTRYCVHPRPWVDGLPTVGGTKDPDAERIAGLRPDLIVVNREENRPEHFPALEAIAPLHEGTPRTVDEALEDLVALAVRTGAGPRGDALRARIEARRERARDVAAGRPPFRFAYLIWQAPWMAVGGDTYLSSLLADVGGVNVFADRPERYPTVGLDQLVAAAPERVLLASEPFPFTAAHVDTLGPLAPRARLVDGELLCWHGSRMESAFAYLGTLDRP